MLFFSHKYQCVICSVTREFKTTREAFHRVRDKRKRKQKDKYDVNKHSLSDVAKDYRKVLNTSYFRVTTLISCLGKLFIYILNTRLNILF